MVDIIGTLIVGAIAGYLASIVVGTNKDQGCITDIVVGVVGGFIGKNFVTLIFEDGLIGVDILDTIVFATIGAIVFLIALGFFIPGRRRRR